MSAFSDRIMSHSPLVYYRLNETGTANPSDSSGNDIHGTMTGGYIWGQPGALSEDIDTALAIDGATIGFAKRSLPANKTLMAFVKTTSTDATSIYEGDPALTVWGDTSASVWDNFGIHGGKVQFRRFNNTSWQVFTGATDVNDGEWHMIAVTYDSTTRMVKLYVDGAEDGSGTMTAHQAQGSVNTLGRGYSSDRFIGSLDEAAVFNFALSPTDIAALYADAQGEGDQGEDEGYTSGFFLGDIPFSAGAIGSDPVVALAIGTSILWPPEGDPVEHETGDLTWLDESVTWFDEQVSWNV